MPIRLKAGHESQCAGASVGAFFSMILVSRLPDEVICRLLATRPGGVGKELNRGGWVGVNKFAGMNGQGGAPASKYSVSAGAPKLSASLESAESAATILDSHRGGCRRYRLGGGRMRVSPCVCGHVIVKHFVRMNESNPS